MTHLFGVGRAVRNGDTPAVLTFQMSVGWQECGDLLQSHETL